MENEHQDLTEKLPELRRLREVQLPTSQRSIFLLHKTWSIKATQAYYILLVGLKNPGKEDFINHSRKTSNYKSTVHTNKLP